VVSFILPCQQSNTGLSNTRDLIARQNETAKEMAQSYVFQLLEKETDEIGKLNT